MKTRIQQLIRISTPATIRKAFALATVAIAITTSSFASDVNRVNFQTLQTFNNMFLDVEDVQWSIKNEYTKASFLQDGEKMEAYFDMAGDHIGTSRAISTQTLPPAARKQIENKYNSYTWKEVIEFTGKDSQHYFVSLENEKNAVILQVSLQGEISVFKSTKK